MMTRQMSRMISGLFIATVFLGAMLGFQIQPLVSGAILPRFGGSPAVWTVCLLFFQSVLFAGYYYAFRLIRSFDVRVQLFVHVVLLSLAMLAPVLPSTSWRPPNDENSELRILWLLTCHTGLPYLVLCATGPLLQVWYLRAIPGASPYPLYACSNAGSILGLVTVPFVMELWYSSAEQASIWYACFATFGLLTTTCAITAVVLRAKSTADAQLGQSGLLKSATSKSRSSSPPHGTTPGALRRLWFMLSMVPAIMLAAVTGKLTTDVSPVPFLWIAPLTIYLVSLVICFSFERLADRRFWIPISGFLMLASALQNCLQNNFWGFDSLPLVFSVHMGTLAAICMVCHGELVRLKPNVADGHEESDRALSEFYLVMALGGAAGGFFTAIIAPLLFSFYLEQHIGLLAAAILSAIVLRREKPSGIPVSFGSLNEIAAYAVVPLLGSLLLFDIAMLQRNSYIITRSFFGVSRVVARRAPGANVPYAFELVHGTTRHGFQFVNPELARFPTTYYGPTSGVGIAFQSHRANQPRRVGVVGLGVGTVAAYGRSGDTYDFYEIDPVVRDLARNFFRYLSDCPATVTVIPGDARLSLEKQQQPARYDLLVLDAFSSDAVPFHLLTSEAFEIYRRHLADDGIIAVHISSQNFDLRPVLAGHAQRLNWSTRCVVDTTFNPAQMTVPTFWVMMSSRGELLESLEMSRAKDAPMINSVDWTDGKHSLFQILGRPSL